MKYSDQPFDIHVIDGVNVVEFHDDITDPFDLERTNQDLHTMVESEERPLIVLDLRNVASINSKLLGVIMGLDVKVLRKKGRLQLCAIQPQVQEVFDLTRLRDILSIHKTREAALAALR
ncbi:MAG: STAS domain-containing protein [Planctomycetota bacterium]|nr:STAS domain-containing protein [Planctomycetota bacterium]